MFDLLFYLFAGITLVCGGLVVANPFSRNPVTSAMFLVLSIVSLAGLFVLLHAFFLAAVQILVYAGAILVLYLFVVMLLNLKREERFHHQLTVGLFLGCMLFAEAVLLVVKGEMSLGAHLPDLGGGTQLTKGNTESIGELLYSTYLFPFEIASLILLVAMVGAVILTKKGILEAKG